MLIKAHIDGTPADADTYIDLIEAQAFLSLRGYDASSLTEAHLLIAMDYLAGLPYCGTPVHAGQPLPFPRTMPKQHTINAFAIIGKAQAWTAYYALEGKLGAGHTIPLNTAGGVIEKTVDVLTTKWSAPKTSALDVDFYREFPLLEQTLKPVLCANSGGATGNAGRLYRA